MPPLVRRLFPFLVWMREVDRPTLRADLLAGLISAVLVLPQGVAYATLAGKTMRLHVAVASGDGRQWFEIEDQADIATDAEAQTFGEAVGMALKEKVPPQLLL